MKNHLLAALSGLLLTLSFPPFGAWPLAWLALAPLIWAALESRDARAAANLGGEAGLVFYGLSLHWLIKVFGPMAAAFWCLFALWIALAMAVLWRLWHEGAWPGRRHPLPWAILGAACWTGIEYFRSEILWIPCPWLALGFSQAKSLPLLQAASLVGIYGLSGLIVFVNAVAALLLKGRPAGSLLASGTLAVLAVWGHSRIDRIEAREGRPVSLALVQDESFDLDRLAALSLSPGAREADLLIWPEYGFNVQPGQEDSYRRLVSRKLQGSKAVAVLGGAIIPENLKEGGMRNFSWVLSPDGELLGRYDKLHPIPFVERYLAPNPAPRPLATPLGILGPQICYDLDFEDGARLMARQGAQILAVTNLDPLDWGVWQHRQHSAMAALRAVESGLWVGRAASSGFSQIISPAGRVAAALAPGESGVLLGTARLSSAGTFYSDWGWLLPRLCLALAAVLLAWSGYSNWT